MSETVRHFGHKWISLGGPVLDPDNHLTLLHSSPLLSGSSTCVIDEAASPKAEVRISQMSGENFPPSCSIDSRVLDAGFKGLCYRSEVSSVITMIP